MWLFVSSCKTKKKRQQIFPCLQVHLPYLGHIDHVPCLGKDILGFPTWQQGMDVYRSLICLSISIHCPWSWHFIAFVLSHLNCQYRHLQCKDELYLEIYKSSGYWPKSLDQETLTAVIVEALLSQKLQEKSQTLGQRVQERTINDCFNAGVLLTIREGYTHLKSVPVTLENTWIFSTLENTWIFSKSNTTMLTKCWAYMLVQFAAYCSLKSW